MADRTSVPISKTVDGKGRLALGPRFANRTVLIRNVDETEVVVTLARVIPEREAWLYENPKARALVKTGLEQAAAGRFHKAPPDLDGDAKLADRLEDK